MNERRHRLAGVRLYLVCGDEGDDFLDAALRGGVDMVQLRMKDADDAAILAAGRRFRPIIEHHGALFILNDRPDLVAAVDADGTHVGQDDLAVGAAREIVGGDRLVGLSTHTPAQIDAAASAPVDYIGVGPVNATPTKPGRPAVGLDLVRYAARHATLPFFAIGGISAANLSATRAAGAERVAVVRALTESAEPESDARELRSLLPEQREVTLGTT